jgi:hypothetical protein
VLYEIGAGLGGVGGGGGRDEVRGGRVGGGGCACSMPDLLPVSSTIKYLRRSVMWVGRGGWGVEGGRKGEVLFEGRWEGDGDCVEQAP